MGRRRKPNKKNGENGVATPPPADGDVDADVEFDEVESPPPEAGSITETNEEPPAAPALPAVVAAGPETTEAPAAESPAPPAAPPAEAPAAEPEENANTPLPATTAAAAPATVQGVEALNAYALQTASAEASDAKTVSSMGEASQEAAQPAAETPSPSAATPPRSSTKKVAFINPVVSSITSASDTDAPHESNCIEARCGSCSVM